MTARDRQPHLHRRRRRAARRRRRPHRRGRHRRCGWSRSSRCCRSTAGSRTPAGRGGCGPAWPASGSACSAWSTAAGRRKARAGRRASPAEPPADPLEPAGEGNRGYGQTVRRARRRRRDIDGEARLADALAPRGARVLDVGSGMGRVAAALAATRARAWSRSSRTPRCVAQSPRDLPGPDGHRPRGARPATRPHAGTVRPRGLRRQRAGLPRRGHRAAGAGPAARRCSRPAAACWPASTSRGGQAGSRLYPPEELVADAEPLGLRVDLRGRLLRAAHPRPTSTPCGCCPADDSGRRRA